MPQDDLASQWKSFDQDKRTRLLGKMSPEQKKKLRGMLEGGGPKTLGEQYNAKRSTGQLPKSDVYTFRNPKEFLQQDVGRLQQTAQEEQYKATPELGPASPVRRAGHAVLSGVAETGALAEGAVRSLMDWKNAIATAAFSNPVTAPLGAVYFSTTGMKGVVDSGTDIIKYGATPENTQQLLTSGAMVVGAGAGEMKAPSIRELRKSVTDKMQPLARKVTGVEPAVKEAVTKAAEAHTGKTAAHELTKTVDEQSVALGEHLNKVEASVKAEADAKFDKVREKLGVTPENPGPAVPSDTLVGTVKNAQEVTLNKIPESIKEFKAILQHEGVPDSLTEAVKEHAGFTPEGPEPLTWSKLQSIKSRLDARLRSGISNGDVYRAVRDVRDGVVGEMGSLAEQHGAGAEWGQAKETWAQYKQDFHEPSGPSGSGSPVAQALRAKDPKNIRDPFMRKDAATGNRGLDILRKYPQHGGTEAAAHADTLIQNAQEMSKPVTRQPKEPTVDVNKVAGEAIKKRAARWGDVNARDVGIIMSGGVGEIIGGALGGNFLERLGGAALGVGMYEGGKFAGARALSRPRVIEWLSKTPQSELDVIAKIPGADKVKIVNALTDVAVKAKAPNLSPGVRTLLGPANVARIMAASQAGVPKNRKEALDLLGIAH